MDRLALGLAVFDYTAVAVFAASGALAAARKKHDIVTFAFFAAVTGVGGGTLRDILIDAPVFWLNKPAYLVVCLLAAVVIWFVGWGRGRERLLLWVDAPGGAAYAIVGALKATSLGLPPLTAVVMGVLTGTFGGVLRDILAQEPSILLKRQLYVTPALVGSSLFVILVEWGTGGLVASIAGFLAAFLLRAGAIIFGWALPGFPGRAPPVEAGPA
jgi:uncharacterized membrane protein YeiH